MKGSIRPLLSILMLVVLATTLNFRIFIYGRRVFKVAATQQPSPTQTFNSTLLNFAAIDIGEEKSKLEIDQLLERNYDNERRTKGYTTWRRFNHYDANAKAKSKRDNKLLVMFKSPKFHHYWLDFRRNLQDWARKKVFQPNIMMELVQLVKVPIDGYNGFIGTNKYKSCAIVGNSGILLNKKYGNLIDDYEIVIRLNNARIKGFEKQVGTKTNISFVNSNVLHLCAKGGESCFCDPYGPNVPLLFAGPDRVGKKKMASVLSNQVCGADPVVIGLGSRRDDGESDLSFRGKTVLDRIAEAIKRNPFSVVMLEDIDEANMLVRGGIKQAMERGRLTDSHGREISLGNVIFILTANWLPDNLKFSSNGISLDEKKLTCIASGGWQLRLSVLEKTSKRRACWLHEASRATKPRKDTGSPLCFDLNEATNVEDGSHHSSDLTVNHEEHGLANRLSSNSTSSISRELLDSVNDAIVFKPVDFGPIRRNISNNITKRFSSIIGERVSIEIIDDALEKIMSGVWIGRTGLEEWIEKTLVPSLQRLKTQFPVSDESLVVRLELDDESCERSHGDWLPGSVKVVLDAFS